MVASVLNISRRQVYFKTVICYFHFMLLIWNHLSFVCYICNGKYESINSIVWMSTWVSNLAKIYVESIVNEAPKPGLLFFLPIILNIILSMTPTASSFAFQLELITS